MPMTRGYIPFHPNPSKPKYRPPAGAVDAHCHVFGPEAKFPYAPERKYTPYDAPKEKLFALRDFLGFDKSVIVQASCHSKDNRATVDALETSAGRAKGVAFVGEEVSDEELKWLDRAGVKGVRFNPSALAFYCLHYRGQHSEHGPTGPHQRISQDIRAARDRLDRRGNGGTAVGMIGFVVARFLNMYPIDVAIVNACHSGQGGTGDVAILRAANRMQLMPFAQIATRIGGAITVTVVLIILSRVT